MAYVLRYSYTFKSFAGDDCEVKFFFKDSESTAHTRLNPGVKPFVLREFNSDNDFFKPLRPMQAEMEILADNVTSEDFTFNSDDAVQVVFLFNGVNFWVGWLIQDDFQENWIDTNHYLTLKATDALGQVNSQTTSFNSGENSMLDYLVDSITNTSVGSGIAGRTFVNNLFYEGMNDRDDGRFTALTQTFTGFRTFEGENKLTLLERINKAWTMTVFQYYTRWWFIRLEEFITDLPAQGVVQGLVTNQSFSKTFEVNIGVNETIKPIMPEMLKTLRRPYKQTTIKYLNEYPRYLLNNQLFNSGTYISPGKWTIDNWTRFNVPSIIRNSPSSVPFWRQELYDSLGNVIDNYLRMQTDFSEDFVTTDPIPVNTNDTLDISFDFRIQASTPIGGPVNCAYILLQSTDSGITYWYTLDNNGEWHLTPNLVTNIVKVSLDYNGDGFAWRTFSVKTEGMPRNGDVYLYLLNNIAADTGFKNITIELQQYKNTFGVTGDYDRYTLPENITQNFEEQAYLDDSDNKITKGALLWYDADTDQNRITGDRWYRMDFPDERLTFKRHKAIAHMKLNRRLRRLLQVNMLGNTWMDGSVKRPIWLQNKFIFTDDAPTKKWMIVNLSEMDFSTTEWKAQLIEVWDDDIDSNDPELYPPHSFGNIFEGE